jgi:hypothetical protein
MNKAPGAAEPIFWSALLVGIVGVPLLLWTHARGMGHAEGVLVGIILIGLAAFGFGLALLLAAYGGAPLYPPLIAVAALGALAGGLYAVYLAASAVGLIRFYVFVILVIDALGVAAVPQAWRMGRVNVEPGDAGRSKSG